MRNENNPSLFRRLSEPHESAEALNAAIKAFMADVAAARERHGLLNVVLVVSSPAMDEGQERVYQGSISLGDELKVPLMLAQALGDAQHDLETKIEALKEGKGCKR